MRRQPAFTLLELLIAFALASFVMVGLAQLYYGVIRYLENTREVMVVNRKVCLLFNQMERDFSSAFIPFLQEEEKEDKKENKKEGEEEEKPVGKESTEEAKKKKKERARRSFFIGTIDERSDAETLKLERRRVEQFKSLTFICSNPFQVYDQKRIRLVRVIYELVIDKESSTRDSISYKLLRKETCDLSNVHGKIDEYALAQPGKVIKTYVLSDGIKGFFVEYAALEDGLRRDEKKERREKSKKEEPKEVRFSQWGSRKETQGVVPQKICVWIDFWSEDKKNSSRFQNLFPVMSYPTSEEEEKKDKEGAVEGPSNESKKPGKGQADKRQEKTPKKAIGRK